MPVPPFATKDPGTDAIVSATTERPEFDMPVAPRDYAVRLLHIGAEVEHALMTQYIYAAYSLDENQDGQNHKELVQKWKKTILEIAREEMGHLVTVQNLLSLIGGPLCLEREDYPIHDAELLPFPFQLEPLTKISLGRYVLAEMPSEQVLRKLDLEDEIGKIKEKVQAADDSKVRRVGLIYDAIASLLTFGPLIQGPIVHEAMDLHPFVATVDIQASNLKFQVTPGAWGLGYKDLLIEVAEDRASALSAIKVISEQGEGSEVPQKLSKPRRVYQRWLSAAGTTKVEALKQAQLDLLQGKAISRSMNPSAAMPTAISYSHPYYWAPFVLMGNWQ